MLPRQFNATAPGKEPYGSQDIRCTPTLLEGYFCVDTADSKPGTPVFNRTVSLKDTWAKIEKGQKKKGK